MTRKPIKIIKKNASLDMEKWDKQFCVKHSTEKALSWSLWNMFEKGRVRPAVNFNFYLMTTTYAVHVFVYYSSLIVRRKQRNFLECFFIRIFFYILREHHHFFWRRLRLSLLVKPKKAAWFGRLANTSW